MKNVNIEELKSALTTLTGDNGRIYPDCALSNPDAAGHNEVVAALQTVHGEGFTDYLTRDEWYYMDDEERSEYAEDYEGFCIECDSFNSNVVSNAIRIIENKLAA